ncbi:M3 family metallopeptidase [Flavobacteriaceae bacterium LSUCC0859]|jgi:peptidyl-dipeptidase Dcp|nr:M3 family metallopeptidase [Flavobacteriaceae bacterium LSUCC0859]
MSQPNPLLEDFNTPPFHLIKNEHFLPAFQNAMAQAKSEIKQIKEQQEAATFENTIAALDYAGKLLSQISSIFFNLNAAETNPEMQEIAQEVSPLLSAFNNDLSLDPDLFARVLEVQKQKDSLGLDKESERLLDKTYKSFVRNGALLSSQEQEELRKIDSRLSSLQLSFGNHVLADTNAFEMHLTDKEALEGLPESAVNAAAELAKSKDKKGWLISLSYPSYVPFMKFSSRRDLREKLYKAFTSKGFQDNSNNNEAIVLELVKLRQQRAQLLGYENHAQYVLEERMAKSPAKVKDFLNHLLEKALPAAKREFEELSAFAKEKLGISDLQKWDSAYVSEKWRQQRFNFDEELLKPYLALDASVKGVFEVARKLFGLRFEQDTNIPVYHSEVKSYKVYDEKNNFISYFYTDFHPRPGKRDGAWMTSFRSQYTENGENFRPQVAIVCNFSRPTKNTPALLTFSELTTLFHEFGHALHGMLANTRYPSLSGTSVSWDFVELPSQLMENWCYEEEALALFAKHYENQSDIPMEMVQKIKDQATFLEGMATLRQLSFGMLDMAWHSTAAPDIKEVSAFEKEAFAGTDLFPEVPGSAMSTAFSHIFQGGYAAGYYSYKWAEVLDADAFAHFKASGIFNTEVARSFKEHILSKGGSEDPMDLYIKFRGAAPKPEALLKRAGLLE